MIFKMMANKRSIYGVFRVYVVNVWIMLWSKVRLFFGFRYDKKYIPKGLYCYMPDVEKNNSKAADDNLYYIKPCPYYMGLGRRYNGCQYTGHITDDSTFEDQCKICGENYPDESDYN